MSDCLVAERQEKGTCTLSKKHARTLRKGTISPHDISTFSRSFGKYHKRKRKRPFLGIQYICAVCGLPLLPSSGKESGEKGTQLAFRLSSATVGSEHVHGNISIGRRAARAKDGRIARNTQQVSLGKESYNLASQTPIPSIRVD